MGIFKLSELKKATIYITPNFPSLTTRRYKIDLLRLFLYMFFYTLAVAIIVMLVFVFTPVKNIIFLFDNGELNAQKTQVVDLEKQVSFLTEQLESISSTNQRLKYAIMLAKSDSLDSTSAVYDSLRTFRNQKLKIGGDIYSAFINLFSKSGQEKDNSKREMFFAPSSGVILQGFDPSRGHFGIDYGLKTGSPVYASQGGLVIFADYLIDSGYVMMIQHDSNCISVYKHCSVLMKKAREYVNQGELIALSGNSGSNTTGPHLHFEIWQDGRPIDPLKVLIK